MPKKSDTTIEYLPGGVRLVSTGKDQPTTERPVASVEYLPGGVRLVSTKKRKR